MNRSLLLLALMPLCALADNSFEAQEAKQQIDPDAPTFKRVVNNSSFMVYKGEPIKTNSSEASEVTERNCKLRLIQRQYTFAIAGKEGKVMYGFPITVRELVCGDFVTRNGGLFWGDLIQRRHFFWKYIMYNTNVRSPVRQYSSDTFSEEFSGLNPHIDYEDAQTLWKRTTPQDKVAASLLKKLIEANKQDSSVTALPVECTDIKE